MENFTEQKTTLGLYDPQFEHDACGIGAVVDIKGRKSHQTVDDALSIVERLEHRAGKDAEGKTGDGVGILLQISHKFFSKVAEELNIRLGNEREYGVGMFFFPQNEHLRAQAMKLFEVVTGILRGLGASFLSMIITVLGICGIRILWIYTIFRIPAYHTQQCLYISYPLSWVLTFIVQMIAFVVVFHKCETRAKQTVIED